MIFSTSCRNKDYNVIINGKDIFDQPINIDKTIHKDYWLLINKIKTTQTTDASNLVRKLTITQKLVELKKKRLDHNHDKYVTTQEFKQANLVNKSDTTDFVKRNNNNKLKNINKNVASNKSRLVEAEEKLNNLTEVVKLISTKGYNFLLVRMYFTSDDDY